MADMHRLGHVRPTEIDHHLARRLHHVRTGPLIGCDLGGAFGIEVLGRTQIDEARAGDLGCADLRQAVQEIDQLAGQLPRIGLRLLGRRHGAIALEGKDFRVLLGRGDTAQLARKLEGSKRVAQRGAELIGN